MALTAPEISLLPISKPMSRRSVRYSAFNQAFFYAPDLDELEELVPGVRFGCTLFHVDARS
jgi:hypothetical protein